MPFEHLSSSQDNVVIENNPASRDKSQVIYQHDLENRENEIIIVYKSGLEKINIPPGIIMDCFFVEI